MPLNSNASTVSSEIDAIIARAMQEYASAKGIDIFDDIQVPVDAAVNTAASTGLPWDDAVITEAAEPVHEEIPANSGSLLVSETTSRFSSAVWFDNIQTKRVMLAGLGGIGSYVAFLLSRLNVNRVDMFDDDRVEAGNLSGQLFQSSHIGRFKVSAVADVMANFSNFYNYNCYEERFEEGSSPEFIMMCGFDNMEARRNYFNSWKRFVEALDEADKKKCLFIDGRLAAESFQILCITGDADYNIKKYEKDYLFKDSEAEETICSYKQTTFMANMIASVMVNLFVNFCANECDPLVPRDLPFFTEYSAETMFFKVIN